MYSFVKTNNLVVEKFQIQINKVQPWSFQRRIIINPLETNAILISNKSILHFLKFIIHETRINWSSSFKFFNVTIDRNKNFLEHSKLTLIKAEATGYVPFPMLNYKIPLSIRIKAYIYKTYIWPIIIYTSATWYLNISKSSRSLIPQHPLKYSRLHVTYLGLRSKLFYSQFGRIFDP